MTTPMVCCPLDGGEEGPTCFRKVVRRAKKSHNCCECREVIPAGAQYEYCSGIWDTRPSSYKTCLSCVEIRNHFSCGRGWTYACVWEQLEEYFFPDMRAGGPCMEGLSPAAKARLFERRLKWLERFE